MSDAEEEPEEDFIEPETAEPEDEEHALEKKLLELTEKETMQDSGIAAVLKEADLEPEMEEESVDIEEAESCICYYRSCGFFCFNGFFRFCHLFWFYNLFRFLLISLIFFILFLWNRTIQLT